MLSAKSSAVLAVLKSLNKFLQYLKNNAEQLQVIERMNLIIKKAFNNLLAQSIIPHQLPAPI